MNVALIEEIGQILLQAIQLGIQFAPELIADIKLLWSLATSGTTLTADQQTKADTTLAAAHQALQAQVALDAQEDAADATNTTGG